MIHFLRHILKPQSKYPVTTEVMVLNPTAIHFKEQSFLISSGDQYALHPDRIASISQKNAPEEVAELLVTLGRHVDAVDGNTAFVICRGCVHIEALVSDVYFCCVSEDGAESIWCAGVVD